jgi:hypothetical protein
VWVSQRHQSMSASATAFAESGHGGPAPKGACERVTIRGGNVNIAQRLVRARLRREVGMILTRKSATVIPLAELETAKNGCCSPPAGPQQGRPSVDAKAPTGFIAALGLWFWRGPAPRRPAVMPKVDRRGRASPTRSPPLSGGAPSGHRKSATSSRSTRSALAYQRFLTRQRRAGRGGAGAGYSQLLLSAKVTTPKAPAAAKPIGRSQCPAGSATMRRW